MEKTEIDCSSVAEKSKSRSITHTMWSITTVCHPFWNLEFPWTSLFLMHSRLQWLAINLEIERTAFWPVKYCFSDHSQCCSEYYEIIQFGGCKCMYAYVAVRRVVASQEQTSWFCYLILQSILIYQGSVYVCLHVDWQGQDEVSTAAKQESQKAELGFLPMRCQDL